MTASTDGLFERILARGRDDLMQQGLSAAEEYRAGDPFPHIVIDEFLNANYLVDVALEHEKFSELTKGKILWRMMKSGEGHK